MKVPNILLYAIPLGIVAVIVESVIIHFRGKKAIDLKDLICSAILGTGKIIISLFTKVATLGIYFYIFNNYRFYTFSMSQWWVWILAFLATDLSYYWLHRTSHRIRWFWASHMTHHSSSNFNFLVGFRHGWTSNLTGALIFYLWMPMAGFNPLCIFICMQMNFVYGFLHHTELVTKLWKPIELIFVTPSHHRVHHGSNIKYLDVNYGGVLIVWDRFFGTFVEEKEIPIYGLVKQVKTYNPFKLAFHEWIEMIKDVLHAPTLRDKVMHLFAPPGWFHPTKNNEKKLPD